MKKALLLILLMTFCVWANAALAVFTDVPLHHPHSKAIDFVRDEGIVSGYPDGTFKPEQSINRAEFTKIIIEAVLGQAPLEHAGQCFPDVDSEAWFYPYVCYAKRMDIISGFPDGTFRPTQNISFAEAAKIVANSFHLEVGLGETWFQPYIDALEEKNAVPLTIKGPTAVLSRGEMAEIIYRILGSDQFKADNALAEMKQKVIEYTNEERKKAGLNTLKYSAYLESSAQAHADDMQIRDYFEHETPEGKTPTERIKDSGYLYDYENCNCSKSYAVGENLGKGQTAADEVVATWMNSAEHKANILNNKFSEIGIGITRITEQNNGNFQGYFWVQNFGDVELEK